MSLVIQKLKEVRERSRARIEAFLKEVREKGVIPAIVSAVDKLVKGGPSVATQVVKKWKFPLLRITAYTVLKTGAFIGKLVLGGKAPIVQTLEKKAEEIIQPLRGIKLPSIPKPPVLIPAKKTATVTSAATAKTPGEVTYKLYGGS